MAENAQVARLKKGWQDEVFAECRKIPNIARAAKNVGVSRGTIYNHRESDPEFAKALKDALDEGVENCEEELHRRAFEGTLVPKTVAGKREEIRQYSDVLAMFLLKAHKPEKYRDHHSIEHKGSIRKPLEVAGLDRIMEQWKAVWKGRGGHNS